MLTIRDEYESLEKEQGQKLETQLLQLSPFISQFSNFCQQNAHFTRDSFCEIHHHITIAAVWYKYIGHRSTRILRGGHTWVVASVVSNCLGEVLEVPW